MVALAFAGLVSGLALPAYADDATPSEPSIKVKFRDLDLSKPEGAAALYQRIERSARLVCTDSSSPYDAGRVATFDRCYKAAVQDAVSTIDQPQLTALHHAKTETPVHVGSAK
jgi:UrcA family protein